jgi:phage-related protein
MPAKFYAASGINADFGIQDESAFNILIQSYSYDVTSDKAEIFNTDGELEHSHRYGKKATISINGIGTTIPNVGDKITSLVNTGAGALGGTILVDSVTQNLTSEGFASVDISMTQYDAVLS